MQVVEWRRQKELLEKAGPLSLHNVIASLSPDGDYGEEDANLRKAEDADDPAAAPGKRLRKRAAQPAPDADSAEEEIPRGARARRDLAAVAARKPALERVEYDGGQARTASRLPHEALHRQRCCGTRAAQIAGGLEWQSDCRQA